jgi:outer membrane protein assembly factor BamB
MAHRRRPLLPVAAAGAAAVVLVLAGLAVIARPAVPAAVAAPSVAAPSELTTAGSATPSPVPSTSVPAPSAGAPSTAVVGAPPFPNGLLIADRGNGRLLIVDDAGRILWSFPHRGAVLPNQAFSADDAFISADGRTIVANDEFHEVIDRIDIATGRIVWQFGHYGRPGAGPRALHTPDDAYPLPNGDIVVADIENCRVLEIAPDRSIVRQWGRTGDCRDAPPVAYARPNGDTPLPDGGMLITEITGSRVVRLDAHGHVVFDIHVPVAYPSDAQLDSNGNVVVADFSTNGQVVDVNPSTAKVVWRWAYPSGPRRLDHPSLATPLPDGTVSVNDDFRHRVVVIDPVRGRVVWQFGRTDQPGRSPTSLNTPDGHEPLPLPAP